VNGSWLLKSRERIYVYGYRIDSLYGRVWRTHVVRISIYIWYVYLYIYVGRVHIYIYGGIHRYVYILFAVCCSVCAVCCSVYAVCCSVLQYVAPGYWDTLNSLFDVTQVVTMQSVAVCCSLLQSVAACGSVTSGLLNVSQVMTRRMYD